MQRSVKSAASSSAPRTGMSPNRSTGEITTSANAAAINFSANGTRRSRSSGTVRKIAVFAAKSKRMSLIATNYSAARLEFRGRRRLPRRRAGATPRRARPSPKTVCVARLQRSQAWHPAAAARRLRNDSRNSFTHEPFMECLIPAPASTENSADVKWPPNWVDGKHE